MSDLMQIPAGWILTPFKDLLETKSGNSKLIKGTLHSSPGEGLYKGFSASGQDVWLDHHEQEGDAIIVSAVGARCGKAFKASSEWSAIANTHIVKPLPGAFDISYLFRFINREDFWVKGGSAQPFVKVNATFEQDLLLPPLAEQTRIAAKLDELLAQVDTLKARIDGIPALLKRFRQSVLAAAVSGRLTGDWRVANPEQRAEQTIKTLKAARPASEQKHEPVFFEESPYIPESWEWASLGFLVSPDEALCYGVVQPGEDDPEGIYLIRAGDLNSGVVDTSQLRRISLKVHGEYRRSQVKGGEVLVTVVGAGIGESAIVPAECDGFKEPLIYSTKPGHSVSPRRLR